MKPITIPESSIGRLTPKDFVVTVPIANRHYSMPVSRPAQWRACGEVRPGHRDMQRMRTRHSRGPFGKTGHGLSGRRCAQDMPARVQDHDQPGIEFIDRFEPA